MNNEAKKIKSGVSVLKEIQENYKSFGYKQFKMNRFEEYDTYVEIKDFLISDKVITFTDTNGKLLAMKPDVTVSIIKNSDDTAPFVEKVYYNENVYRVSKGTREFREIMQTGLECIGNIDDYNISEVITLAAMSLSSISESFVLDISHMGFVSGLISACGFTNSEAAKILKAISEKNMPEVVSVCEKKQLSKALTDKVCELISLYGPIDTVAQKLDEMCINDEMCIAAKSIMVLCEALKESGFSKNIQLDFSVVNDMNYYNGIVFRGYIEGVPEGVLSGGQYDKLMNKMGKNAQAIGFAVYLDLLERLSNEKDGFDADVLILYDETVKPSFVLKKATEIISEGKTVLVEKLGAKSARTKQVITIKEGGEKLEIS